ncbi:MAG: alpha/beta fold hydrolase [Mycobacteriales bacterium]
MRGYLPTRWGQLHYSCTGTSAKDAPTFVLCHETPLSWHAYERLIPMLEQDHRVIAVDTPGYGQSDGPGSPTTMEEYATTIIEGLDVLDVGRVITYGLHTGASLALQIAVDLAEQGRTAGVAVSGLPYYSDEVRQARRVRQIPPVVDDGSHLTDTFRWEPDNYDAILRSRLVAGVIMQPERGYDAFHAVYRYQPARLLDRVTFPALTLSHRGDVLFDCDERFVAGVPQARMVLVDAERLPVYWTAPRSCAEQLSAFAAET